MRCGLGELLRIGILPIQYISIDESFTMEKGNKTTEADGTILELNELMISFYFHSISILFLRIPYLA